MLECLYRSARLRVRQRLADSVKVWPHFPPPVDRGNLTVFEVAFVDSVEEHVPRVREWAEQVWEAWSDWHAAVAVLVVNHLSLS
ncbi:MAG: DUF5946 family protein [Planctomycetota bacterium]